MSGISARDNSGALHINSEDEKKDRASPDVRDGLKPVQRRILFGLHGMGLHSNHSTRKCAKIVREVLRKYDPHGDTPYSKRLTAYRVYDSLVRMAQTFLTRYPLIDGRGNFGSIDGDPPVIMQCSKARLSRIAGVLLEDIDKDTVDMLRNYDDSEDEPEVLPTRVPNLLINGASRIPPHNLKEIIDACIVLLHEPNTPLAKIVELVPGPDFPTGGYIIGRQGIYDYFTTGRGSLNIRAKAATEKLGKDFESIVVTEIPYEVKKARLIEQVAALVEKRIIEGISKVRDESNRAGMRIVFELKRGSSAEAVLSSLYRQTEMETSFGVILRANVNGQVQELGLIDIIKRFLDHRTEVVRRRTEYLLRKAREKEHIFLGFRKAFDIMDKVVSLIPAAADPKDALQGLFTRFEFTERQAKAILELQLLHLTRMERTSILKELDALQPLIGEYMEILGSEKVLKSLIINELKEVQKEFGDERLTQIVAEAGSLS